MIKYIFLIIIFSFSIAYSDIEDEIYEPDFDQETLSKQEINYEKNLSFQKLMTCVFKTTDYKRLFRFGLTDDEKFFYRKVILQDQKIKGFADEEIYLARDKDEFYLLIIDKNFNKLNLQINFDKKRSKLDINSNLVDKVNCK